MRSFSSLHCVKILFIIYFFFFFFAVLSFTYYINWTEWNWIRSSLNIFCAHRYSQQGGWPSSPFLCPLALPSPACELACLLTWNTGYKRTRGRAVCLYGKGMPHAYRPRTKHDRPATYQPHWPLLPTAKHARCEGMKQKCMAANTRADTERHTSVNTVHTLSHKHTKACCAGQAKLF